MYTQPFDFEVLSSGNYCVECLIHIFDMTEYHLDLTEGHCWNCFPGGHSMETRFDFDDPKSTVAIILPEVSQTFGSMEESRIRKIATANGIVLQTRYGNKKALLVELSNIFTEKRKRNGRESSRL